MKIIKFKYALLTVLSMALLVMGVSATATVHAAQPEESIQEDGLIANIANESNKGPGESLLPPKEAAIPKDQTGTISLRLTDGKNGTTKSGIHFDCIQIADLVNGEFALDPALKQSGVDLNAIENSDAASQAAEKLSGYTMTGTTATTDQTGEIVFPDLAVGVYLIKAEDSETFDLISPSLIAIPTWNETEGDMQYEIHLEPKHTPRPDPVNTDRTAPQTNVQDRTVAYLVAAGICLIGACLIGLVRIRRKPHVR